MSGSTSTTGAATASPAAPTTVQIPVPAPAPAAPAPVPPSSATPAPTGTAAVSTASAAGSGIAGSSSNQAQLNWAGVMNFGVLKGGPPLQSPPGGFHTQGFVPHTRGGAELMLEDFEQKYDPNAAFENFSKKNRAKAVEDLKATGQEPTDSEVNQKLNQMFSELSEEQKKAHMPQNVKRVRVQRGVQPVPLSLEKFDKMKLKQHSGVIIKAIDKLYGMGVAVTMALASRDGTTYKYFPEELANEREAMKSLDQHLLQLQYALWDDRDLGQMIFRQTNTKEKTPNSKVTCKKTLGNVIRPRLQSILGGQISWKKLQSGSTKLLGWPLKDKETGRDRFPNRFFDLKISEMKSILAVIDGIAVIDHEREGRHVVEIVQTHIDRIVKTYTDKQPENKELQAYIGRLQTAIANVPTGNLGAAPTIAPLPMQVEVVPQLPSQPGQPPSSIPQVHVVQDSTIQIEGASMPPAPAQPNTM